MSIEKQIKDLNKQLYPTGRAWGFIHDSDQVDQVVTRFVDAIGQPFVDGVGNQFISIFGTEASGAKRLINADLVSQIRLYDDILSILNIIIPDNDNFSETDAENWERVYAITTGALDIEDRKNAILRKLAYPNGVTERAYYSFIQEQLRINGFDVYVHENRIYDGSGGWDVFNPILPIPDYSIVANYIDEDKDAGYLDPSLNENNLGFGHLGGFSLSNSSILDIDTQLRYSFFISGSAINFDPGDVLIARKDEFRKLILGLKQLHTIGILYINYI